MATNKSTLSKVEEEKLKMKDTASKVPYSTIMKGWTISENKDHAQTSVKMPKMPEMPKMPTMSVMQEKKEIVKPSKKEPVKKVLPKKVTPKKEPEINPTILPRFGYTIPPSQLDKLPGKTVIQDKFVHSLDVPRSYDGALAVAKKAYVDPQVLIIQHKEKKKLFNKLQREYFGYGETSELANVMGDKQREILSFKITCASLFLIIFLLYMMYGVRYW